MVEELERMLTAYTGEPETLLKVGDKIGAKFLHLLEIVEVISEGQYLFRDLGRRTIERGLCSHTIHFVHCDACDKDAQRLFCQEKETK